MQKTVVFNMNLEHTFIHVMTFRDKEMYWLANCDLIQARIVKSKKKK